MFRFLKGDSGTTFYDLSILSFLFINQSPDSFMFMTVATEKISTWTVTLVQWQNTFCLMWWLLDLFYGALHFCIFPIKTRLHKLSTTFWMKVHGKKTAQKNKFELMRYANEIEKTCQLHRLFLFFLSLRITAYRHLVMHYISCPLEYPSNWKYYCSYI